MSKSDSLGDRMKGYENVAKTKLLCRTPVIIRIDGKAFHTWTKKLRPMSNADPFNEDMHDMMLAASQFLMMNIQNAVLAYTQSDEISILLNDWKKLNTDQWFGNSIQKMASVSASIATAGFNFKAGTIGYIEQLHDFALFDARVFNIPKEEVNNYFIWRQQDATRNSIQMLARHFFSHKEMHRKSTSQAQDMLMLEKGVNWNDLDTWKKRGACVVPNPDKYSSVTPIDIDEEIPIFTKDWNYVERFLEADDV